jgi:hypothetical protein
MNLHTHKRGGEEPDYEPDYSEENPRPREEFAKEFIRAYDGALKRIMHGEKPKSNLNETIEELKRYAEEERKNGSPRGRRRIRSALKQAVQIFQNTLKYPQNPHFVEILTI